MKKKLLMIGKDQFGYLVDTYKYCEYLNDDYEITYFCINRNNPMIELNNTKVKYTNINRGLFKQFLVLLKEVISHLKKTEDRYDKIFIVYFRFCFLLTFFMPREKVILDIRTGNVSKGKLKRIISDFELKFNAMFFKKVTVISEGLANKLNIKNFQVLPLGADKMLEERKKIDGFNLLYVGTLHGRNIEDTILGYSKFLKNYNYKIDSKYTIIGNGTVQDNETILNTIKKEGLEERVFFLGRKKHSELGNYFFEHNIGISYIPMTAYYDYQPPTKTYEYLMNGLICVATATTENKKVITNQNGILCEDNSLSFCKSLEKVFLNLDEYDNDQIISTVKNYTWNSIINKKLKSILEEE